MEISLGGTPYEAIDQLDLSGTTALVFENSVLPNSGMHPVRLDQGVGRILDGADRAPRDPLWNRKICAAVNITPPQASVVACFLTSRSESTDLPATSAAGPVARCVSPNGAST